MKKTAIKLILSAAAAVIAALLLAGCQERNSKHSPLQEKCEIQTPAFTDTSEMDEETRHRIIQILVL
ncbi:MAG: hypothetical protein MJZ91_07420 [Bacteroidales bacterium]|nr:hypothetical protein [Bacteroidales bacterium]